MSLGFPLLCIDVCATYVTPYRKGVSIARGQYNCFPNHADRDIEQVDAVSVKVGLEEGDVVLFATWFVCWYEKPYGLYECFSVIFYVF